MRVTPKISDIPTEIRNRNIPTLRPLRICTVTSGPLVIQGKRLVTRSTLGLGWRGQVGRDRGGGPGPGRLLLLLGGRRADLGDLLAAPYHLGAVVLLDVGEDRLALGVHLHHAHPLGRDGLLVAAAHGDLAPRELHVVALAERGDDPIGVGAARALDGLDDDVGAGVAPRRAERRLLALGPRLVL